MEHGVSNPRNGGTQRARKVGKLTKKRIAINGWLQPVKLI